MCDKSDKKYELVAPDGGWGYVICFSFVITTGSVIMFVGCFGLIYNEFMIEIGMNSTMTTLATGLNGCCFAVSGFLTSSLLKRISLRKLCMLAVVIHNAGALSLVFVKSIMPFLLCQGIMMGSGVGITYTLSCTTLNEYFVKKRTFAFSLVQFFSGMTMTVAPMFVKWSLQEYGYRGTLLLIAGIMMHNIFGVLLMHPVKWHMKREEVMVIAEMHPLLVGDKNNAVPTIKITNEDKPVPDKAVNEIIFDEGKKSSIRRFLETIVDVPFALKFILSCSCIGPSIANFADSTFALILPQALYALNWSSDKIALAISISGIGDLVMRIIFILANKWLFKFGSQPVYVAGLFLAGLARLGMLWSENEIVIFTFIVLMGIARAAISVLLTMVISEVVSPDKFTQAIGISMMYIGFTTLVLGPAIGVIRDLTNSYNTAFYLLTSCFIIIAIFWSLELCYKMNKEKRKLQKENLERIKISRSNKGK